MKSLTNNYTWSFFYILAWFFLDFKEGGSLKAPVIDSHILFPENVDTPENETLEEQNHRAYQKYLESSIFKKVIKNVLNCRLERLFEANSETHLEVFSFCIILLYMTAPVWQF